MLADVLKRVLFGVKGGGKHLLPFTTVSGQFLCLRNTACKYRKYLPDESIHCGRQISPFLLPRKGNNYFSFPRNNLPPFPPNTSDSSFRTTWVTYKSRLPLQETSITTGALRRMEAPTPEEISPSEKNEEGDLRDQRKLFLSLRRNFLHLSLPSSRPLRIFLAGE
ncbi:hypothetical protein CDAR_418861 [Caerostris darwini]|uniref:Uncharacterized protein n=1 Tax=Caerostris darwini TaxID=1538125 RepID=A0AAV4MV69_9ARAC|nr:hypothetical protein CDAR_418861 [Caerostris darwini]